MKSIFVKILIVVVSVTAFVPLLPTKTADAQWVVEFGPAATTLITGILTATGTTAGATVSTAATAGVVGVGSVTVAAAKATLGSTCQATIAALSASNAVSTVLDATSNSALSVIGGGTLEFGKLSAKLAKATAAKACVDLYVAALSAAPGVTLQQGQELAREQDKYTKISSSLQDTIDNISSQQNASAKDIMKAFMVKLVLNLNKNLTTNLVNKMVEKYKISDFQAYADALGTQVYSMKYINDNFDGDPEQQMMIRSLLQSEAIPSKVKTAEAIANTQAQNYLGKACNVTSSSNSSDQDLMSYIKCLSAYGDPEANGQYKMLNAVDHAQAAKQAGQTSAAAEISQSNGFAPPRNCSGSITMQNQIDSQFDSATNAKSIADLTEAKLSAALKAGKTTQAEYDKALTAKNQAQADYNALKDNTKNPIIKICEGIATPAQFVSTSIGDFIKQHIDQASDLKSDNLPFYATFLSDMASNFLTNILTGGKSTSQVFKEAGASALNSALGGLSASTSGSGTTGGTPPVVSGGNTGTDNGPSTVKIYAWDNSDSVQNIVTSFVPGKTYTIEVNFNSFSSSSPYKINVQSSTGSISAINRALTDKEKSNGYIDITYTAGNAAVTLTANIIGKDSSGADKTLGSGNISYSVAGAVKGASIVLPRGPELSFR